MKKVKFECDGHYIFDIHEGETPSPCRNLPFYSEYEGKRYCVLHFPKQEKFEHFEKAIEEKINRQDYNFRNIWIPDGTYFGCKHFKSEVDFSYAVFNGEANFEKSTFEDSVIFDSVEFKSDAIFNVTTFSSFTSFLNATFNKTASFQSTRFGGVDKSKIIFIKSEFVGIADFSYAEFDCIAEFNSVKLNDTVFFELSSFASIVDFKDAVFRDYVKFSGEYVVLPLDCGKNEFNKVFGEESSLNLQFATFEKPERVLFHTTLLRPHWFVNVDSRKFEFTDIDWINLKKTKSSIENEIDDLTFRLYENIISPHKLFAIACSRLGTNAEENNRYEEASNFRYLAMDSQRLETSKGFSPQTLNWWYWLLSGYGEDWKRAFFWLIGILLTCSILYAMPFSIFKEELNFWNIFGYSLNVFALQRPEPRPVNWFATLVVGFEAVFAPLQAALLILAVRRKFMR